MENRRQDYRHIFPAGALPVECLFPTGKRSGEVYDLSVSGISIRLHDSIPPVKPGQWFEVRILLRPGMVLGLLAEIIHENRGPDHRVGMRFLPLEDPAAEENRHRTLWGFLLEEQRKRRRLELAGKTLNPV